MLFSNTHKLVIQKTISNNTVAGIVLGGQRNTKYTWTKQEVFIPLPRTFIKPEQDLVILGNKIYADLAVGKTMSGKPRINNVISNCENNKLHLILSSEKVQPTIHNGFILAHKNNKNDIVHALGTEAIKKHGGFGYYDEALITPSDGSLFKVMWSSGKDSFAATCYWIKNNEVYTCFAYELDSFLDSRNIDIKIDNNSWNRVV